MKPQHSELEVTLTGARATLPATTAAASWDGLASRPEPAPPDGRGWAACLATLREWITAASTWDEDGVVPPSPQTIRFAMRFAARLRDEGTPGPTRVVPDGEGGLVFERREGRLFETFTVTAGTTVELDRYRDSRLLSSEEFPLVAFL